MPKYVAPAFKEKSFTCPHCDVTAKMLWGNLISERTEEKCQPIRFLCATCSHCGDNSIWRVDKDNGRSISIPLRRSATDGVMVYPNMLYAPPVPDDMPPDVIVDYMEAASIRQKSPRGSAALLRLALQKLCKNLGEPGKNINDDIRALAEKKKVSQEVIHMADVLRITGNCSVHPGEMSDDDIDEISDNLFDLINYIVKEAISDPNFRSSMYSKMPEKLRKKAEEADAKNKEKSS